MKIRNGFVSNSSSSSFICECCGENISGMDMCASDADMRTCEKGHMFCSEHIVDSEEFEKVLEKLRGNEDDFDPEDEDTEFDYDEDTYDLEWYNVPEKHCPICNLKYLPDYVLIDYLVKKLGSSKEAVKEEIQKNYKTLNEI
ncbi:MAG: hypothetical protein WC755_09025 [Candidatus Woesearchaeota archaeon]|jgi:hypothetical protein